MNSKPRKQEHLGQVAQGSAYNEPAKYNPEYDVGGKLQVIARTTSPLVELPLAPG
jgi:hypothetical protein